jgi:hypothetical protein
MFFGNSKNALKRGTNRPRLAENIAGLNYVVIFVDESNPNYTNNEGNTTGLCWEPDVQRYRTELQAALTILDGQDPPILIFDLDPSCCGTAIWPEQVESASRPPNNLETIVRIQRPNPESDFNQQNAFHLSVRETMSSRWGNFAQDIIDNDRSISFIVDVSGSMTIATLQQAINLLVSWAESLGIPSEKINVLSSCSEERWLMWALSGILETGDLGCDGNCNSYNIQECKECCIGPENSICIGQCQRCLYAPRFVYDCISNILREYTCEDWLGEVGNGCGFGYVWRRTGGGGGAPPCDGGPEGGGAPAQDPISCDPNTPGNKLTINEHGNPVKIWSPGWINTSTPRTKMCITYREGIYNGSEAGVATPNCDSSTDPYCVDCNECGASPIVSEPGVNICGCSGNFIPQICGATGGSAGFYKCVKCSYLPEKWNPEKPWPPTSFGGMGNEFCGMAQCSITSGTYFGEAITFSYEDVSTSSCTGCEGKTASCFTAHSGTGCNFPDLCCAVCAIDSVCCDFEWDQDCADLAATLFLESKYNFTGWTGGANSRPYFTPCPTSSFAALLYNYKDLQGNCTPCPLTHPNTGYDLYQMEGCTDSSNGCTTCAETYGFTGPDLLGPWNRCGLTC